MGREGSLVVPPKLTHCLIKNSLCDATGRKPASLFQVRRNFAVIPLLYNGSARIGLLTFMCSPVQLGGPFRYCAFALLSELLLGSLEIALKRTRPRQRFWSIVGRYSMTEREKSQEVESLENSSG